MSPFSMFEPEPPPPGVVSKQMFAWAVRLDFANLSKH
jgi:hypothetical protein